MKKRRLHIGGKQSNPGWEVLNAVAGPEVDHLGNAKDYHVLRIIFFGSCMHLMSLNILTTQWSLAWH